MSSFAIRADGSALAWGANSRAQLGDGSTTDRLRPQPMIGIGHGVSALAEGVASRADGSVVSWGGEQPAEQIGADASLPIGATKLGGRPDLAPGTSWPAFAQRPMAFVAQINLADVAPHDERGLLPRAGLLSFFCSPADLDEHEAHQVFLTDATTELSRAQPPTGLADSDRSPAAGLGATPRLSFLPAESSLLERHGLSEQERLAYGQVVEQDDGPIHRMLGHPDTIQHDPRDAQPHPCLLLQVDSEEATRMEWGDVGRLYLWIHPDDLQARRLDRTWLDFQCY